MNAVLASLLVFLAIANADLVNYVSTGTTHTGTLLPSTTPNAQADYYAVWIPQTAMNVTITFNSVLDSQQSNCDLLLTRSFWSVPCPENFPDGDNTENQCFEGTDDQNSYSGEPTTITTLVPGYSLSDWRVGSYLYLAVSRYDVSPPATTTCLYSFEVDVANCPSGQVGFYNENLDTIACAATTNVTFTNGKATVDLVNAVEGMLAMWLPLNVGTLYVTANNSISGIDMYAQPWGTPSADEYSYSSSYVTDNYIEMDCYVPPMGWFYILIEEGDGTPFNSTIMLNYTVCPTGMGGYNCAFPLRMFNMTYNNAIQYINYNQTSLDDEGPFDYYYLDFAPNTTLSVYLNATYQGEGTVYYRRNGFPEYDWNDLSEDDSGETYTFEFFWQSLYTGGRYFIGIQNRDYYNINYTLAYGMGPAPTTTGSGSTTTTTTTGTGSGTTGTTTMTVTSTGTSGNETSTGEDTTGMTTSEVSTTSSASAVVASIAVVVVALAAMF